MIEIAPETRISAEHGWLCIRNETGWLMWSAKLNDMPDKGLFLAEIVAEANRNAMPAAMPANPRPCASHD